jgi:hypothetical protein
MNAIIAKSVSIERPEERKPATPTAESSEAVSKLRSHNSMKHHHRHYHHMHHVEALPDGSMADKSSVKSEHLTGARMKGTSPSNETETNTVKSAPMKTSSSYSSPTKKQSPSEEASDGAPSICSPLMDKVISKIDMVYPNSIPHPISRRNCCNSTTPGQCDHGLSRNDTYEAKIRAKVATHQQGKTCTNKKSANHSSTAEVDQG